ncbi:MAG: NRDE family protein [Anaeromicrobium sp.]|jgi:uncharacterized protein with NRDE domain|uniref:NRDE family protein n=1 Tax=Anaeromicrobium sp. TaxID=1929132 RepID=UPI0025D3CC54|nr:NRDE family protein [Anaeromicrobium sp.]MCT4593746.1 NRDE family protein [Anaeromicrobium sp.]
MCTIVLAYKKHPEYKLILAANRDEFYSRPTREVHFWEDHENVLAGRDLEKMGTWLGITKEGKFSGVTNYRDNSLNVENSKSRGNLVKDYLIGEESPIEYMNKVKRENKLYDSYNLLVGNLNSIYYYSNVSDEMKELEPGVYGLSNHLLDTDWFKVRKAKEKLIGLIENKEKIYEEDLLSILYNKTVPHDDNLPDTGVGIEWERILAPVFVESSEYGTRACTIILVDKKDRVTVVEKSFNNYTWRLKKLEFNIK